MTREVEDSPNRCPRCQTVQLNNHLCYGCQVLTNFERDVLDLLEIMEAICSSLRGNSWHDRKKAELMITTMRQAINKRNS